MRRSVGAVCNPRFPPPPPSIFAPRIPTMEELGFLGETLYTNHWIGGESEALRKLPVYYQLRSQPPSNHVGTISSCLSRTMSVCVSLPPPPPPPPPQVDQLFDKSSLSPYIRFGCLSVRYFLWNVKCYAKSNPKLECLAKEVVSKLLQREFFLIVGAQVRGRETRREGGGGGDVL